MQKEKSRLKWLLSSYNCQRQRGKTHIQIFLEGLGRFTFCPFASTLLMKLALKRHGICRRLKLTNILCDWSSATRPVAHGDILTGRFFVDLSDKLLWDCYLQHYESKI